MAVPALVTFLSPSAHAALSACNRQLRAFVHSSTQVIHLKQASHINLISQRSWPQLPLVTLPKTKSLQKVLLSSHNNAKVLPAAGLELSLSGAGSQSHQEVLITDSKRHWRKECQPLSPLPHFHSAFLYLSGPCYQHLQRVVPSNSSLDAHGVAQLAAADWPDLRSLDVRDNQLDSVALVQIAWGSRPLLNYLNISLNKLDSAAVSGLVRGAWPNLGTLRLSGPTVSDPAGAGAPETADHGPLLGQLDRVCNKLSSDAVLRMGKATWANLHCLDLRWAGIVAAALAALAKGAWPELSSRCLDGNNLDAEAISHLVAALLPNMNSLWLSEISRTSWMPWELSSLLQATDLT